ncbi:16S rRNA (uracil(1498)-N(3))-methyltransferase [soil metagenome]
MRVFRSFVESDPKAGDAITLNEEESHHLATVRRAQRGDDVVLVNGRGLEAVGSLESAGKRVLVLVKEVLRAEAAPPAPLEAACAVTKSGNFEDLLQRAVELGMTAFRPIVTKRGTVEFDDQRAEKKVAKWRANGIEALKQCERLWLPEFDAPRSFGDVLDAVQETGKRAVILQERALNIPTLTELLNRDLPRGVVLFVGPEGGWAPEELELADQEGAAFATLGGDAVLRTETALLAALALAGGVARKGC